MNQVSGIVVVPVVREVVPENTSGGGKPLEQRCPRHRAIYTVCHRIDAVFQNVIDHPFETVFVVAIGTKYNRAPNDHSVIVNTIDRFVKFISAYAKVYVLLHAFKDFFAVGFQSHQETETT